MNNSIRCTIPFKGLDLGRHSFEFEIDDRFFSMFENAVVQKGKAFIQVDLVKLNNLMECDIAIDGEVAVECDRCLDEFYIPITYQGKLLVSTSKQATDEYEQNEEEDVDIMLIHPSTDELDLSQYCYESIGLSLPLQKVHPNDANGNSTCNKDMLERLKSLLVG